LSSTPAEPASSCDVSAGPGLAAVYRPPGDRRAERRRL